MSFCNATIERKKTLAPEIKHTTHRSPPPCLYEPLALCPCTVLTDVLRLPAFFRGYLAEGLVDLTIGQRSKENKNKKNCLIKSHLQDNSGPRRLPLVHVPRAALLTTKRDDQL